MLARAYPWMIPAVQPAFASSAGEWSGETPLDDSRAGAALAGPVDGIAHAAQASAQPPSLGVAAIEVIICSGFVTQIVVAAALSFVGMPPALTLGYLTTLSLVDTALLLLLILLFLRRSGDAPRDVFLGRRPVSREVLAGVGYIPIVFVLVLVVGSLILRFAPWLHNLEQNPLEALLSNPRDALLFGVVAVVAGGLREEMQRAFVLTRFRQSLGGGALGLVLFSVAFGAGHLLQGYDAAIITGTLGAMWGGLYLGRGSIVAPFVSHAAFNLIEVVRFGFF